MNLRKALLRNAQELVWNSAVWIAMRQKGEFSDDPYTRKIRAIHALLQIPKDYASRGLIQHRECSSLIPIPNTTRRKTLLMDRQALSSFSAMQKRADRDGVELSLKWAYRSVDDQSHLILDRLRWGGKIAEILTSVAAPGYSEHHTGRAIDIAHPAGTTEAFEKTQVFTWLEQNAQNFGFVMSYPRNNHQNIIYEPWHWLYKS